MPPKNKNVIGNVNVADTGSLMMVMRRRKKVELVPCYLKYAPSRKKRRIIHIQLDKRLGEKNWKLWRDNISTVCRRHSVVADYELGARLIAIDTKVLEPARYVTVWMKKRAKALHRDFAVDLKREMVEFPCGVVVKTSLLGLVRISASKAVAPIPVASKAIPVYTRTFKVGKRVLTYHCPPWREIKMSDALLAKLPPKDETTHTMFFSSEKQVYECFNAQKDDSYTNTKATFFFEIPSERAWRVWKVIKENWALAVDPFVVAKKVPKVYKMDCNLLARLLIDEFDLGVTFSQFFKRKTKGSQAFYDWPCQILQAKGYLRFGRVSWRLR